MWDRRARITDHDGDTVTGVLDQGYGDTKEIQVRLLGVYAPELDEPGGPETRDFVLAWMTEAFKSAPKKDWPVVLISARTPRSDKDQETLGRYVATITNSDGTRNLNAEVIAFVRAQGYGGGIGAS